MVASSSTETVFEITYSIHVYRHVWDAALSETLVCGRKVTDEKYRCAFAVKKLGTIAGRAKNISQVQTCARCPSLSWRTIVVQLWKGSATHLMFNVWNFSVPIMRCKKYFSCLIFVALSNHEILLPTKISGLSVFFYKAVVKEIFYTRDPLVTVKFSYENSVHRQCLH